MRLPHRRATNARCPVLARRTRSVILAGMQTLVVDTNSIVKKLEQPGFSGQQAEGITEALKELDTSPLVTKTDFNDAVRALEIAMRDQAIIIIRSGVFPDCSVSSPAE